MAKYRNPRHEEFMQEQEALEKEDKVLEIPATNVEEETWKKRYADQRRYVDNLRNEAKREQEELRQKLDAALRGELKVPKSKEEVKEWAEQYPEFAGILETLVEDKIETKTSYVNKRVEELDAEKAEREREKAILALKKKHPDFEELIKDTKFHAWLEEQDPSFGDKIYNGLNVAEASLVITAYKAETKTSRPVARDEDNSSLASRPVSKAGSTNPSDNGGEYLFSESQIERESKRNRNWFSQNEDKIMEAARAGKILMDISGGAR